MNTNTVTVSDTLTTQQQHAALCKKLQAMRLDCLGIKQTGKIEIGNTSYLYYTKQFLYNFITRLGVKHKVNINPETIDASDPIEIIVATRSGEKKMLRTKITKNYEFTDLETGYHIRYMGIGEGQTDAASDKSFQSASTACDTKFYVSFFRITEMPDEQPNLQVPYIANKGAAVAKATKKWSLPMPIVNKRGIISEFNITAIVKWIEKSFTEMMDPKNIACHLIDYMYSTTEAHWFNGAIFSLTTTNKPLLLQCDTTQKKEKLPNFDKFDNIINQNVNGKTVKDIIKEAKEYLQEYDYTDEYYYLHGMILAKVVAKQPNN